MSEICTTCGQVTCVNTPDMEAYSLQNNALYNAQYIFLVQCPTGYFCPSGLFPKYVTIKKDRKSIPFPPPGATSISVQGCQSLIVVSIPSGSSTAAIQALMQSALLQWAGQQAICDSITENNLQKKSSFVFNDLVSQTCSGDRLFRLSNPYSLPPTVYVEDGKLWLKAKATSSGTKAQANAQAEAFLSALIAQLVTAGVLECGYWNTEQTFNCGLSTQTVPAFLFFSTVSQAAADAAALAAAQLQCNPMAICGWSDVLPLLPGGCTASTFPAWDGVFDLVNFDSPIYGDTIYYFKSKSINSFATAADEPTNLDYPNGNWQDNGAFTAIYGITGSYWQLNIYCTNGTFLWRGDWVSNEKTLGDTGPAGRYEAQMGYTPASICVQPVSEEYCNCCHITPATLPDGDEDVAYSQQLSLDDEIQGTWSVTGGALPSGVTLSSAGLLSGTPTESGTFNFEVTVDGCVKDMSLDVTASALVPNWSALKWAGTTNFGVTFTPAVNASSDSFEAIFPGASQNESCTKTGSLPIGFKYNGPGANCNLHLELSAEYVDSGFAFLVMIEYFTTSIPLTEALRLGDGSNVPAGASDHPFSIPDSGGEDMSIKVYVWPSMIFPPYAITISGQVTNV